MKIAAAYVRVSTDDQAEYSPESQIKVIRDHATRDGYIIPEDFVFREIGISGKRAENRPQFMMLIGRAKEPEPGFDRIYVWEFSRFARNQEESIVYKNLLRKRGITVQSIKEPLADSPFASLIERIIEWMDEFYVINLATEVRRGMAEKASRGEAIGPAPFGYQYDPDNKTWAENPEEAGIVRYLFEEYAQGGTLSRLALELQDRGIKTRQGNAPSLRWVRYILSNPVYIGKIRWSREGKNDYSHKPDPEKTMLIDGKHPALVSTGLFEAAQKRITANSEPKRARREAEDYMLRGLVKCSACGKTLSRWYPSRPGRQYDAALQCTGYSARRCRESHFVYLRDANKAILDYLSKVVMDGSFVFAPAVPSAPAMQWDRMIAAERRRIDRAREAYLDGTFTADEYKAAKEAAESNIAKFQSAAVETPAPPSDARESVLNVLDVLQDPTVSETGKNEALHSIIDRIVFDRAQKRFDVFFRP